MPGSGRFARVTIKLHEFAKNDLAVTLGLPSGEELIFNTWEEFDDWFVQQHIHKRSHHGAKEHPRGRAPERREGGHQSSAGRPQ